MSRHDSQRGAVSLFVVIFSALLITVVTVSFIRLMLQDQREATNNDLSQSAYDSALAGTEDAKRALIRYRTICESGNQAACAAAHDLINSDDCNRGLTNIVSTGTTGEIIVEQSADDTALNQAYTCVKMQLETDDYLGTLDTNSSKLVPLIGVNDFDTVLVEWYTSDDLDTADIGNYVVTLGSPAADSQPLLAQSDWTASRPSLLRTQLMQFGDNFTLDDFDDSSNGRSNANTLFLYPVGTTGVANSQVDTRAFIDRDVRRTPTGAPLPITCTGVLSSGGYACRARLQLPEPIGGGDRTAYLRLTALYNPTHFRVSLVDTKFDGVQPSIDSTGRASDLFRRVEARVDLVDTDFPFPDGAVGITGSFCKDFVITHDTDDYRSECEP